MDDNSATVLGPGAGVTPLRVLAAARQPVARAGLRVLIEEHEDLVVVGPARSAVDVTEVLAGEGADVALTVWDDIQVLRGLVQAAGALGVPLLVLADTPSPADLGVLLQAGMRGILADEVTSQEVHAALRAVQHGLLVLDPSLVSSLGMPSATRPQEDGATVADLTDREREVLGLLAQGLPNKHIARRLAISEHTVKFHVGSILAKLGAASRTEAVSRAARRGLLAL